MKMFCFHSFIIKFIHTWFVYMFLWLVSSAIETEELLLWTSDWSTFEVYILSVISMLEVIPLIYALRSLFRDNIYYYAVVLLSNIILSGMKYNIGFHKALL